MKPTSAPQEDAAQAPVTSFMLLCFASYLMSLAYGVTFLIPILVSQHGGDESVAGLIIASATITTVLSVILSGHLADRLGAVRCIAAAGIVLVLSGVGFAIAGGALWLLLASALVLGCGWGTFYTLGPILVAAITKPQRRTHFFALLSGAMMTGIGTGPILGRVVTSLGLPIEFAFIIAAASSILGVIIFFYLHGILKHLGIAVRGNKITFSSARSVVSSRALYPIVMVGLGGCLFGCISSFQTSYALERGYDYSLFFIGFISAAILCRLFLSGTIVRLEPHRTSFALTNLMVISILV
jgi:MFS family permease